MPAGTHNATPGPVPDGNIGRSPRPTISTRVLASAVVVALLAQLVVLMAQSRHQWQHFNLSLDFAIFHQAWHQIGAGDLNPKITLVGYSFWKSHLELIAWPLGLLGRLHRDDGLSMLYLQDLAVIGTEAAAIAWVWAATRERRGGWPITLTVPMTLGLLLANPWIYRLTNEDFHFEALATFFLVLGAWELWSGRRRGWVWIALTLLCGDVAGTYVVGLGLSFVAASKRTRRDGLYLICVGLAFFVLIGVLGANRGAGIAKYTYLTKSKQPVEGLGGLFEVVSGMLRHPSRPLHMLHSKMHRVFDHLSPTGVIGLLAPWSAGVVLVVLLENALNGDSGFINVGFQNAPVYPFAIVGTMLLLLSLSRRRDLWRFVALAGLIAAVANAAVYDKQNLHNLNIYHVSSIAAGELGTVRKLVPNNAEVIASFGVVGRFAGRKSVYAPIYGNTRLPVEAKKVVFVIAPHSGNQPRPPGELAAVKAYVHEALRARVVYDGSEVTAYEWTPPPGQRSVVVP